MGKIIYLVIAALVTAVDLLGATRTLRSKRPHTIHFALALYGAALAEVTYTQTILVKSVFLAKLSFACFFSCIPVMLLFLQMYLINYTGMKLTGMIRAFLILEWVLAAVDVVCQFINPFREIVMGYFYDPKSTAPWGFLPKTLYNLHLGYCYFIIAAILLFLIRKLLSTPYVYRQKYYLIFAAMFFAVAINAVCLVLQNAGIPDYSQISYSVLGFIIYIDTFYNSQSGMLTRTRQVILDELGHPLVLFGEDNKVAARNKAAEFLIPGWKSGLDYNLSSFLTAWGFSSKLEQCSENTSFQWSCKTGGKTTVYRVDVHILKDKKGLIIGRLFEFTDMSLGVDILTGFDSHNAFLLHANAQEAKDPAPYCAAVLDINNLVEINRLHGSETGDLCISFLAREMRAAFPENCYFARPLEANLLAIAPGLSVSQVRDAFEKIRSVCRQGSDTIPPFDIQYAAVSSSDAPGIKEAWEIAAFSMRSKKLLDKSSAHSSLMDSMVQTLMEADETTNAHVERTRKLGEQLGMRLGFSDLQLSDLSLLCLLHDIGKLGIPLEILNKPGKLSPDEWEIMKSHTEKGYRIALASPELSRIADYIRCHHECWNGKGYPSGLQQESIPLLSRVISIVDAYDAMTNDRPYHKAMSSEEARAELLRCAGTQFDPNLTAEFVRMLEEAEHSS